MDDRVLAGLLEVVVISMVPVTVFAVLIHRERLREVSVSLGRRAHVLPAARALGVATSLELLPSGIDREAERLRVEVALEAAGMSWQLHQD
jgi:hypothetical protein